MPDKAYILCTTPRSGNTLLCDLLTDSGVAGQPDSFFRRESFREWADFFRVDNSAWDQDHFFDRTYLAATKQYGTNDTRVFGMRLMWESLNDLCSRLGALYPDKASDRDRLCAAFDSPNYIYLRREDKIAQAISHLRAEQSGLWHAHADNSERERLSPPKPLRYDYAEIAMLVDQHNAYERQWARWFNGQQITPIPVVYEQLSADPAATLGALLCRLELEPAKSTPAKPRTARLADDTSQQWYDRYLSEYRARR